MNSNLQQKPPAEEMAALQQNPPAEEMASKSLKPKEIINETKSTAKWLSELNKRFVLDFFPD